MAHWADEDIRNAAAMVRQMAGYHLDHDPAHDLLNGMSRRELWMCALLLGDRVVTERQRVLRLLHRLDGDGEMTGDEARAAAIEDTQRDLEKLVDRLLEDRR